jgi:hypothetical protein
LVPKKLSLLHELVPNAAVIALLVDLNVADAAQVNEVQAAARTLRLQLVVLNVRTASDIDAAFASLVRERASALVVGAGAFLLSRRCVALCPLKVRTSTNLPGRCGPLDYANQGDQAAGAGIPSGVR